MAKGSVEVQEVQIPVSAIQALSEQQRYFHYLMGLIYNEAMCLRKLISFTVPSHGDQRAFRRNAELSQTFFLFRIACSKVWEARLKLTNGVIASVLRADVFPHWSDGQAELRALNRQIDKAKWLADMRNSVGFHYPELSQWRPFITPGPNWVDDTIFFGTEPGNQYFDASEQIVREQMFRSMPGTSPADQIGNLVEEMVSLLVDLNQFVERALGHFALAHLLANFAPKVAGRVVAPPLNEVEIPFWTSPREGGGRSKRKRR